jgi:mono/diheme cytochrome c family protein
MAAAVTAIGCFETGDPFNDDLGGSDTTNATAFGKLYDAYLSGCANCHAPGALGRTSETEKSLDFSTEATAYATLKGTATGLVGNQQACNGAAFLGSTYQESLLAAVLDEDVRAAFQAPGAAGCNADAVSDMTVRMPGAMPAGFLSDLQAWIDGGAL